jgi:hypothetical protein
MPLFVCGTSAEELPLGAVDHSVVTQITRVRGMIWKRADKAGVAVSRPSRGASSHQLQSRPGDRDCRASH